MRGFIHKNGHLVLSKNGRPYAPQLCPHKAAASEHKACSVNCPLFGEPQKEDFEMVRIDLCNDKSIFLSEFQDRRE